MLDRYWHGVVDRISPEAPVPVVRITHEEERLGGAANVAVNVKALGARVTLMTVVGEDEPARRLRALLAANGICTLLGSDIKLSTTVKLRIIGRAQQLMRLDFENTPDEDVLTKLIVQYEQALAVHDVVLFSDYGKGVLAHVPQMIDLARRAGKPVLVDPKGSDYGRYAGATVITPNRAELTEVVGTWLDETALERSAQELRIQLGLRGLLLTRSEEGMSLFDESGHLYVTAQAREVFDVTGAGDTVIATLAVMLACGLTLPEAVPMANKAAGLVVGKFGTASVSFEDLF